MTPGLCICQTEYFTRYGLTMAGLLIGSIPLVILFIFTSGWFVFGLTSGVIRVQGTKDFCFSSQRKTK